MSTVHLLNAAVMPASNGIYTSRPVQAFEFSNIAACAHKDGNLVSYVGYPETAEILSDLCKFPIPVNRAETVIEPGDLLLVAKLTYRPNATDKGKLKPKIDDFEFRVVEFEEQG